MLSFFSLQPAAPVPEFDAEVAASALIASLTAEPSSTSRTEVQGGGGSSASATASVPSPAPAPAPLASCRVWDRSEFLSHCAANAALLTGLLDEWLADAYPCAATLSSILGALFGSLESDVDAMCAGYLASFQGTVCASGLSPAHVALVMHSRAYQHYTRELLSAWLVQDAEYWRGTARKEVEQWLGRLSPQPAGSPPTARLCDLAAMHMRLALWPHVVDANCQWRLGSKPAPLAYAAKTCALFSLTGRTVSEGGAVLPLGPGLTGREPKCALGGEGGAKAALPAELADLGGAGCRQVVTEAAPASQPQ